LIKRQVIVFVGPTGLSPVDCQSLTFRPPACCGDLDQILRPEETIVVLVDAAFLHRSGPTHPELIQLMNKGAMLVGAASFGALRATELGRFGMIGVGKVYSAFVSGLITDDAEVSVAMRSDTFAAVSIPLVNLRRLLFEASVLGVPYLQLAHAFEICRNIYFMERSERKLRKEWQKQCPSIADLLSELLYRREMFDVKRSDADAAVRFAVATIGNNRLPKLPADLEPTTDLFDLHEKPKTIRVDNLNPLAGGPYNG
jgi:hypothetical protein